MEGRLGIGGCGKRSLKLRSCSDDERRGEVLLEFVWSSWKFSRESRKYEFQCFSDQPNCRYNRYKRLLSLGEVGMF